MGIERSEHGPHEYWGTNICTVRISKRICPTVVRALGKSIRLDAAIQTTECKSNDKRSTQLATKYLPQYLTNPVGSAFVPFLRICGSFNPALNGTQSIHDPNVPTHSSALKPAKLRKDHYDQASDI